MRIRRIFICFLLFFFVVNLFAKKNVAVICGLSEYAGPPEIQNDLKAPGADKAARLFYDTLLSESDEWMPENIAYLQNQYVTMDNIVLAINYLTGPNGLENDDVFLFYYSGHLSQNIEQPGGEKDENDGLDEFLRLYDFYPQHPKESNPVKRIQNPYSNGKKTISVFNVKNTDKGMLLDDDIDDLINYQKLGTKNIIVILDACHSRGMGEDRRIPIGGGGVAVPDFENNFSLDFLSEVKTKSLTRDLTGNTLLLASCSEFELTPPIGNPELMPAFTFLLCKSIKEVPYDIDGYVYQDFTGTRDNCLSAEECFFYVKDKWDEYVRLNKLNHNLGVPDHPFHEPLQHLWRPQHLEIMDSRKYLEIELINLNTY